LTLGCHVTKYLSLCNFSGFLRHECGQRASPAEASGPALRHLVASATCAGSAMESLGPPGLVIGSRASVLLSVVGW
jgi:hypothetical protein